MFEYNKGYFLLEKYVIFFVERLIGVVVIEVLVCVVLILVVLVGNFLVLWMVCKNKNF